MKCDKCGSNMQYEIIGLCVVYECPECYNIEEIKETKEYKEYEKDM